MAEERHEGLEVRDAGVVEGMRGWKGRDAGLNYSM